MDPMRRVEHAISVKVSEAKDLFKGGEPDTYCVIKVNHREIARSKTAFGSGNPSFDAEATKEVPEDLKDLTVVLWESTNRFISDVPLGMVTVTAAEMLQNRNQHVEKWFPLYACETEGSVTGEVILELMRSDGNITVTVQSGVNLVSRDVNGFSDPYVVLHVLPDPGAVSTQATKVKKKTLNPKFDEKFIFKNAANVPNALLHVSVWDWDRFTDDDFMGYTTFDLSKLEEGQRKNVSLPLLPKPAEIKDTDASVVAASDSQDTLSAKDKKNKKKEMAIKGRAFVMEMQAFQAGASRANLQPQVTGSMRLKFRYSAEPILDIDHYANLLKVIREDSYRLPVLLGKVSSDREDAAWSLVKIAQSQNDAVPFLNYIISHEVASTLDPNTIFRSNSMASKAVDVYMKLVALEYLSDTIGPVIREIMISKKSAEVDPTRLEKNDDIKKNWKVLKAFTSSLIDAIFKSADRVPLPLQAVFSHLRTACASQWPMDSVVGFTSVAGFIFLRLFVAATLNPILFGVWPDHADQRASRTLTLVAKTLQNLANLNTFGQKEAFMADMNELIEERMGGMKAYLESVSTWTEKKQKLFAATNKKAVDMKGTVRKRMGNGSQVEAQIKVDVPRECTNVFQHLNKSYAAMSEAAAKENLGPNLLVQLRGVLDELAPQLEL